MTGLWAWLNAWATDWLCALAERWYGDGTVERALAEERERLEREEQDT